MLPRDQQLLASKDKLRQSDPIKRPMGININLEHTKYIYAERHILDIIYIKYGIISLLSCDSICVIH